MGDALAVDMDLAAGDVFEAGDDPQQRRLSAAGGTNEDDEFAMLHRQINAVQHVDGAEGFACVREFQFSHWIARSVISFPSSRCPS